MRMVLVVIALAICFVLWDRLANDGRYTAQVERSFHGGKKAVRYYLRQLT